MAEEQTESISEDANHKENIDMSQETEAESTSDNSSKASELDELNDKYLRLAAELENIKKRHLKERADLIKYAGEYFIRDLLEVVDNLERAIINAPDSKLEAAELKDLYSGFFSGLKLVHKNLSSCLEKHQIKSEESVGKSFDPSIHEAIASIESEDSEGKVIEQLKKAYYLKDKLIRPAQVVVSKKKT